MRFEHLGILIVALAWGSYPLLSRAAGGGGLLGTFTIMTAGWGVIAIASISQRASWIRLDGGQLTKLTCAGVLMGIGLIAFNAVSSSRRIDASVSIPIMDTAMLIVTVIAAVLFFAEPFTVKKGVGLALLLAGIVTLNHG